MNIIVASYEDQLYLQQGPAGGVASLSKLGSTIVGDTVEQR